MAARWSRQVGMAGGGLALVLAVCGCTSSGSDPGGAVSGSASPGGSASQSTTESPTPASTLTPAQQQAFDEATDVVLAYRQTITDLYSGARTDLNDLDAVATGELLEKDLRALGIALSSGRIVEPIDARVALVWATPQRMRLNRDSPIVVVRACVDGTGVTTVEADGTVYEGVKEVLDYEVSKTTYLAAPGWAVSRVTGNPDPEDREC